MTRLGLCVLGIATLWLSACGSSPAVPDRYYSLVLAGNDGAIEEKGEAAIARLIIGPVELPAYLSERGLPMQVGPNRIESAHHHFWAEPLDEAIAKVLTQDIGRHTNGIDVERESGRQTAAGDCHLRLEFDAFHATSESSVVASGRYWIASSESSSRQSFDLRRTLTVDGYAHAVDSQRTMLDTLAQRIAHDVQGVAACTGAASKLVE